MDVHKSVLANGLRLLTIPIPGLESVTCLVLTGVGSRYEPREKLGISHVLEHMAFKGTTKRPKPLDIANLVEGVGGAWNAFTSKEMTGYWIKLSGDHFDLALDVLSDILLNPVLNEKELKKEVGVVLEEAKMRKDTPRIHIYDMFDEQLLGDQPLGWDTIGTPQSLRSLNRSDLTQFISKYYKTENMVVVAAGKVNQDVTVKIERYFSGLRSGKTPAYQAALMNQEKPRVKIDHRSTEQAHLAIGVEGVSHTDQDYYPLQVMETILGHGMSSRLWESVRENKGLAYTVRTSSDSYHDTGVFVTYAGVDLNKVDSAVEAILFEYHKLRLKKVDPAELVKGKEYIKGRLKLGLEDTEEVATMFGLRELLERRVLTVSDIISLVERVTAEDILRVATRIFKEENLNLSLIGPFNDENRFLKLLKL